ncbi:MAG: FapA family protein [Peptococcaceae bacterium]|nr:FapA family protein [Peptococcaceae bacterium]
MFSEKDLIDLIKKVAVESSATSIVKAAAEPSPAVTPGNGTARVKEGRIFVQDPGENGAPATITPGPGLELYINGALQCGPAPVVSTDTIELKLLKKELAGKCRLELTRDKMKAYLVVEPARFISYDLLDQEPQQNLLLKTVERERLESPFTLEQLRDMLAAENVTVGLDFSRAGQLLGSPARAKVKVAEGVYPEPPVDEKVEILFPEQMNFNLVVGEDGTVDYRDIQNHFCVEEGALLALKHAGIPGKPGKNVLGEEVQPPAPAKVTIHTGSGTFLSEDGNRVLAKKAGRPVLRKEGKVYHLQVEDVLIHDGDVDLKTGNIRFKGSLVVVHGNVQETMLVRATGLIAIEGTVTGAGVVSHDNIRIEKTAFNSVISAGIAEEKVNELLQLSRRLAEGIAEIIKILDVLLKNEKVQNSKVSYGYLLKIITEQKVTRIPKILDNIISSGKSFFADLPPEIEKTFLTARRIIANPHQAGGKMELLRLLQEIDYAMTYFKSMKGRKAALDIEGAVNCRLFATGDVTLRQKGGFNTTIEAGGNVFVRGVFRGGEIKAGGHVIIDEAGTKMGVKTVIAAGGNGTVKIASCYEGVTIRIGRQSREIVEQTNGLNAFLDREGNLQVNSFKP